MLKRKTWLFMLIALVAISLISTPAGNLVFAVNLARALQALASGTTGERLPVEQTTIHRKMGQQDVEALLYRRTDRLPTRAVILSAGISELGCYHSQLVALSRYLAANGFLVLTPDIQMFRRFEISAEPLNQISFWYAQIRSLKEGRELESVGLAGISFSGTLSLIAAARSDIQPPASFVLGIGSYDDLLRCTREWFAPGPRTVAEGYYPTRFYARWVIMRSALGLLPSPPDRQFLDAFLVSLLLQKDIPAIDPGLTPEAQRWYRLALMREDQSDPELAHEIEQYLKPRLYESLSPELAAAAVRCPVFLVHGSWDDLIPPDESQRLCGRIIHAKSFLLMSPFLTHTHPPEKPLSRAQQIKGLWNTIRFLYNFASVVRNSGIGS
jgi:pimeloyl-ACP methyl ester carboxylesterase